MILGDDDRGRRRAWSASSAWASGFGLARRPPRGRGGEVDRARSSGGWRRRVLLARPPRAEREDFAMLARGLRLPPLAIEDSSTSASARSSRTTTITSSSSSSARARRGRPRRGALLLLRALPRHGAPRRGARPRRAAPGYARRDGLETGIRALYRVVDGLVDSFFPALSEFDDRLELIEDELLERADRRASCTRSSR